ncbi:MAG: flagellar biosynthesis protein FlhA [Maricaulaceae bacterium]
MTESTTAKPQGLDLGGVWAALKRGEVAFATGIVAIIVMLIFPLPSWLLDVALAFSISSAVLVLMNSLFIAKPLEFSAFPTVLLVTTMLRLGLNVASTRLILSNGDQGTNAAGNVIQAFGGFVMGGNFVIGLIVFIILVIVNFVVISRGSSRIAEVGARFSLDAMPGKQMAIDADLSSGLISEDQAKTRRKELEQESNFFGAMDGASKFVRGDAIAGLLITAINLIGGILIGVAQKGMPFGDAAATYSALTIGDGLVSQIPALVISIAAGMLVSKAGVDQRADTALVSQLTNYPQALGMVSACCFITGLLPGMPFLPFAVLSGATGYVAYEMYKRQKVAATPDIADAAPQDAPTQEEPIAAALAMDELKVELGYGLLPLINDVEGRRLTDQIKALRKSLAQEMGVIMPSVRIIDNMQLPTNNYAIRIKEIEAGAGELRAGQLLAMDPAGGRVNLPGDQVTEPTFGLPALWIDANLREEATFRGATVVDPATVLVTHLTELLREHMPELLSFAETEKLLKELPSEHTALVEEISPAQISKSGIQRVLQNLLQERVSIRDLPTIVEGIAEASARTQNYAQITEHVRTRLARQLCHAYASRDGALPIITLSAQWEQAFADALVGQGEDRQLALPPTKLHEFVQAVRQAFDRAAQTGDAPVMITSPIARPYVRSIVERFRGQTVVMSQNEIHPRAKLRTAGHV